MSTAPIIIEERENTLLGGFLKKNGRNERITKLIELTKKLKRIDGLKTKK